MGPGILYSLFATLDAVAKVGPAKYKVLKGLGCKNVLDLLYHLPYNYVDRRDKGPLNRVKGSTVVTKCCTVEHHSSPTYGRSKTPYKIRCKTTDGDYLEVVYFKYNASYLQRVFPVGNQVTVSGKVEESSWSEMHQMPHPDIVLPGNQVTNIAPFEGVYHGSHGASSRYIYSVVQRIREVVPDLPEWINPEIMKRYKWSSWKSAIINIHFPGDSKAVSQYARYVERLAYDEILSHQLHLRIMKSSSLSRSSPRTKASGNLISKLREGLPFTLTDGQEKALSEILSDQDKGQRMRRFIQGDVGCGKTIIALFAMLRAIERGKKAVLMAPTEILALQHYENLSQYCEKIGVHLELVISKMKSSDKKASLKKIEGPDPIIVVGTHALFQKSIAFCDLELVVIDEQHRFGVEQRQSLMSKGKDIDLVMMSATPIPRSLSMLQYGDLDLSVITEKPEERLPTKTLLISDSRIEEVKSALKRAVQKKERVFWVCPLIQESEKSDLANVKHRYEDLVESDIGSVGMVHGRMKPEEREEIMNDFVSGQHDILIATTVVEVGVDVRDATVMVIESPERFGLSQLHQLRGRVGRGDKKSHCMLLYGKNTGEQAMARMTIMHESNDGFKIAEEDLAMRGSGDLAGTKQSGLPDFKVFDIVAHQHLIELAHKQAQKLYSASFASFKSDDKDRKVLEVLMQLFNHK